METFPNFHGNAGVVQTLKQMIAGERIPQTILLSGPEGVGKATLARRFAATLLHDRTKIEQDDLSLPHNLENLAERDKWAADKRADDPLPVFLPSGFHNFSLSMGRFAKSPFIRCASFASGRSSSRSRDHTEFF